MRSFTKKVCSIESWLKTRAERKVSILNFVACLHEAGTRSQIAMLFISF